MEKIVIGLLILLVVCMIFYVQYNANNSVETFVVEQTIPINNGIQLAFEKIPDEYWIKSDNNSWYLKQDPSPGTTISPGPSPEPSTPKYTVSKTLPDGECKDIYISDLYKNLTTNNTNCKTNFCIPQILRDCTKEEITPTDYDNCQVSHQSDCNSPDKDTREKKRAQCPRLCKQCKVDCNNIKDDDPGCKNAYKEDCEKSSTTYYDCPKLCSCK